MSVNGITSSYQALGTSYAATNEPAKELKKTANTGEGVKGFNGPAAEYEKSEEAKAVEAKENADKTSDEKKAVSKAADPELLAKLKADADAKTAQLRSIVEKLLSGQNKAYGIASDNEMWSFLASGDFTVDAATKAQAQQDISEDGYYGVKQTSERIIDFAKALAGDDPEKLEEMRKAFEEGYKQAEETWGGELPQISKDTYDAVQKAFDEITGKTQGTDTTGS